MAAGVVSEIRRLAGAALVLLLMQVLVQAWPGLASGAEIQMSAPPSCGPVSAGVASCLVVPGSLLDVTFALDAPESLNGYDLEVRWDDSELTLVSATQLHPDTGTPGPFLEEPSDPADSRAAVFEFDAIETTQLFRLRFETSFGALDGQADLWWFPNNNGLAPASVTLENAAGAALDIGPIDEAIPALGPTSRTIVALLLALAGTRVARSRLRGPPA